MQLGLQLDVPTPWCLSTLGSLRDWLRLTNDEVLAAIESGAIPFAFDLRSRNAERSELRLWHPNVEALVRSRGADSGPRPILTALWPQIMPSRDVRSSELERWWSVSHQHVNEMIDAGELPVRRARAAASGPHSYTLLSGEELRAFLASRLIGHSGGISFSRR